MKTYLYVKVAFNGMIGGKCEAHRQIIDEKAALGYRYIGFFPTEISDYGKFRCVDLIFEKDVEPEETY